MKVYIEIVHTVFQDKLKIIWVRENILHGYKLSGETKQEEKIHKRSEKIQGHIVTPGIRVGTAAVVAGPTGLKAQ